MYHLCKKSRVYNGVPYNGPTSNYKDASTPSLKEARIMARRFTVLNPVGWDIYDSKTNKIVE